ncbi:MAG: hypothetical protein WC979_05255 [Candidatus Pacearchaeota archaeon]|jgi:hypothetical protein
MKISTTFSREYTPFYDNNCDPEDRSSHIYHSKEDNLINILQENYVTLGDKILMSRNNSLTLISVHKPTRTQLRRESYEVRVFVETEAELSPTHPKELTDILEKQGFCVKKLK